MFDKNKNSKIGINDVKIGKHDNIDLGNNKHNKLTIKGQHNSQTTNSNEVNINFDPNKVTKSLAIELANKIAARDKELYKIRTECPECNSNIDKRVAEIEDEMQEIRIKYDYKKEVLAGKIIYNVEPTLNNLRQTALNALQMIGVPFCEHHKQAGVALQNLQFEIEALENSIKLITK